MADYKHRFGPILRLFKDIGGGSHAQVVAVNGAVTVADGSGSLTVDGPLTDAQLAARLPLSVGGYTATPRVTITRPADTAIYAAGDAWSNSTGVAPQPTPTVPSFAAGRINGGTGLLMGLKLVLSANQTTKPALRVFVFDTTFTPLEDNAPVDLSDAEAARLVAMFDVLPAEWLVTNPAAGASGNIVALAQPAVSRAFACLEASQALYVAVLVYNAYTPTSAEALTLIFDVQQD